MYSDKERARSKSPTQNRTTTSISQSSNSRASVHGEAVGPQKESSLEHAISSTKRRFRVDNLIPLVEFLAEQLSCSKREAKTLIDARSVFVNGRRLWMAKHQLSYGDSVEVVVPTISLSSSQPKTFEILFESPDALVINKPAGIECTDGDHPLEQLIQAQYHGARIVHRLDRDTSGCLIVARDPAKRDFFVKQFSARSIVKIYRALLLGAPPRKRYTVEIPVEGKSACSHFTVLEQAHSRDHLSITDCEVEIESGRMHQIRRHAQVFNAAVLGDKTYEHRKVPERFRLVARQLLHAWKVTFLPSPDATPVTVEAPLPADFLEWQTRIFGVRQN